MPGDARGQPAIRPAVPAAGQRVAWWRGGLAVTAIDEALLGVLSLALALVLIQGGSKAEYGVFALVSSVILLFRGAQGSLVLTPLATVGGRLRGRERVGFVRGLARFQVGFGVVVALALTGGLWVFVGDGGWGLAAGSGLALIGNWLREFRRGLAVMEGRVGGALLGDGVFALLAVAMTLAAWTLLGGLSAGHVLAAIGIAAGGAAFVGFPRPGGPVAPATSPRQVARVSIAQARWTLPGSTIGWVQQSGYIYAVGLVLGPAAVGEMVAARLFVVPLLLLAVAWSRMLLPQAAALLADGGEAVLLARCGRALRMALLGSGLYLVIPAAALVFGVGRLLPADYAGCEMQVLAWGGFAVINLTRSLASTALMARLEFRALFAMTVASAAISLALVVALVGPLGATGAIAGMTAGELLLAVLAWRVLLGPREGQARSALRVEAQSTAC